MTRSSCSVDLDSVDAWPEGNPPILTSSTGDLLLPLGEDQERHFSVGQGQVTNSCRSNTNAALLLGGTAGVPRVQL